VNDADRDAIQDLFARLRSAEAGNPTRDPAAEAYIRDRLEQNPAAAYYMAQTVIAQEHALRAARDRLAAAEDQRPTEQEEPRRGGILGGLFGGRPREPDRAGPWSQQAPQGYAPQQGGPWGRPTGGGMFGGGGGSGFLAGAAQTAVGVAGGVMLGNALTDLFDGHDDHGSDHQSFADTGGQGGGEQGFGGFSGDGFGGDGGSAGFGDAGSDDDLGGDW